GAEAAARQPRAPRPHLAAHRARLRAPAGRLPDEDRGPGQGFGPGGNGHPRVRGPRPRELPRLHAGRQRRGRAPRGRRAGRPAVLARREFAQGSSLVCQFEVYGAAKDPKTSMPKVSMGYLVRGSDGSVFTGTNPSVIRPTSIGKLSRMVGFSLENAAPGDYDI